MVNYACAFSDSELGEKFEWIIIKVNYLFHLLPLMKTGWHSHRLQRKLGYLLNLDLCCLTREWLLFLSLKLTGERLGNRLKHFFFWCALDTSVLGAFVLTLPLYAPSMLSRVASLYGLLYTWLLAQYSGCNLDNQQQTIKKNTNLQLL